MSVCDIVGKTIVLTWGTGCETNIILGENTLRHRTVEETFEGDTEYWIEAKAITMQLADSLYCISWGDNGGNHFTLLLDTLSTEAEATWTYEDGNGNSEPQHTIGKFKFIN